MNIYNVVRKLSLEVEVKNAGSAEAAAKNIVQSFDDMNAAAGRASGGLDGADRSLTSTERRLRTLENRLDPATAAVREFERHMRTLEAAASQGIGVDRLGRNMELAHQRLLKVTGANDNLTRGLGLQRHEWVNLGRQMQDVVTMGAMGATPGQIVMSQAAQVLDIFTSAQNGPVAALKAVAPYAAAVGGLAATFGLAAKAAYDFSEGQDAVARSLNGVGRLSGATVVSINAAAEASASAARVSVGSAREMISQYARTGRIGQDFFGDLTVTASRYARTTGIELPNATSKLADAFGGDVIRGVTDLNKQLGFLSGRTLEVIERQVAMGDRAGAQRTALDAMKTSLVGVAEQTNGLAMAWDSVSRAARDAYDATGRALARRFAPTTAEQIEDMRSRMDTPARRGLNPWQEEARRRRLLTSDQDAMSELLERKMWEDINRTMGQRETDVANKTLLGKSIVGQMSPATADILRLTEYKTALQEALDTGRATTGTAEALDRVNKLLERGGTEASQLRDAARDAFNIAGLRPYERGLAEIENRYNRILETVSDPKVREGLNVARKDERAAYNVQNTDIVVRGYRDRMEEMGRGLQFQRESFGQTPEVVETMRARMEMLNDAARTGQDVAARYGAGWEALAGQMGRAKAATDELQRAQQSAITGMDEMRSGSRGLATGIWSDLRQGKNPTDNILSSLGRMTDQWFDRTVSRPLIEGMMGRDGTGQGGWLTQGLGGLKNLFGGSENPLTPIFGTVGGLVIANDDASDEAVAA